MSDQYLHKLLLKKRYLSNIDSLYSGLLFTAIFGPEISELNSKLLAIGIM